MTILKIGNLEIPGVKGSDCVQGVRLGKWLINITTTRQESLVVSAALLMFRSRSRRWRRCSYSRNLSVPPKTRFRHATPGIIMVIC